MVEEAQARLAVRAGGPQLERKLRLDARVGLDDEQPVVREDTGQDARERGLKVGIHLVRGVDQHEIVTPARLRLAPERPDGVLAQDRSAYAELVEVLLDRTRRGAVRLDEDGPLGAAGERLEAHRARAGAEVEHTRA